ncbi:MAG: D-alanine--D-alanine ligase [Clostridia bacterium]|nr:D-alanine--D-alanine ligase [Clostridia bacterium]
MRVLVLCGGNSPEREVSIASGKMVAKALKERGHEVTLADVCADVDPNARKSSEIPLKTDFKGTVGKGVVSLARRADAVFFALHGGAGENGVLKALFEANGIAVTGNGSKAEMLAMDKSLSKLIFRSNGLKTPKWTVLKRGKPIRQELCFPLVIKPNSGGSSIGVSFAENGQELSDALDGAFLNEDTVLAEEKIVGREFSVGVLLGGALPPIEIIADGGFYDYRNKYVKDAAKEICPAKITPREDAALRKAALLAHELLGLTDISRTDMIMTETGEIFVIETNATPGMTETSLLPKEAAAAGIGYGELCERLLQKAVKRKKDFA